MTRHNPQATSDFPVIDTLAILGSGLIGASVLRASKARELFRRSVVWDIRAENRDFCVSSGWADVATDDLAEAVREADLVVIATPADTVGDLAERIAKHLKPGALVTDAASTKGHIARVAHAAMPEGRHFVAAHPMAGSEKNGPSAAKEDLFEGRACFITPLSGRTDDNAVAAVSGFWKSLGANIVEVSPDDHDEIVAHISHLPHVAAVALAGMLARKPDLWRDCAGGGLRDTTRIAGSDPKLWKTILEQNRDEVLRALRAYQEELHGLERALANRDWFEVQAILERGRAYREQFRQIP
jgi:cyclohexadieny/prephenate dehydrogenase